MGERETKEIFSRKRDTYNKINDLGDVTNFSLGVTTSNSHLYRIVSITIYTMKCVREYIKIIFIVTM